MIDDIRKGYIVTGNSMKEKMSALKSITDKFENAFNLERAYRKSPHVKPLPPWLLDVDCLVSMYVTIDMIDFFAEKVEYGYFIEHEVGTIKPVTVVVMDSNQDLSEIYTSSLIRRRFDVIDTEGSDMIIRESDMHPREIDHKKLYEVFNTNEDLLSFLLTQSIDMYSIAYPVDGLFNSYKYYSLNPSVKTKSAFISLLYSFSEIYFGNRMIVIDNWVFLNPTVNSKDWFRCGDIHCRVESSGTLLTVDIKTGEHKTIEL